MRIFKISGYMIDSGDASARDVINLLGRYLYLRQMHIEEAEVLGKTLADFPENVDLAELNKYFPPKAEYKRSDNRIPPQPGEVWRHFKGHDVEIIGLSEDTEWNTYSVVYKLAFNPVGYEGRLFNRPFNMFMSEVDREKYPDAKQKYRFERVETLRITLA